MYDENLDVYGGRTPTKAEAWAEFWEVIAPALADAYREGRISAEELSISREEHERRLLEAPQPTNVEIRPRFASADRPLAKFGPIPCSMRLEYLTATLEGTPNADGAFRPRRSPQD